MSDEQGTRFTLDEYRKAVAEAGLTPQPCGGCHQPMRVTTTDRHDGLGKSTRIRVEQKCVTPGCEFNTREEAG